MTDMRKLIDMLESVIAEDSTSDLAIIAQQCLGVKTLETRNMDSLDFHNVAVWQIKKALEAAYQAGVRKGRTPQELNNKPRRHPGAGPRGADD